MLRVCVCVCVCVCVSDFKSVYREKENGKRKRAEDGRKRQRM